MSSGPLSIELAKEALEAFEAHDQNTTHAADALKIPRATFQNRLRAAARYGLTGREPVMPGFGISSVSTKIDPDGETTEWIKQKPLTEETFTLPDGHIIKGVSALVDGDGRLIQQWVKTRFDQALVNVKDQLIGAFSEYTGLSKLPAEPLGYTDSDLCTCYNVVDHHLGLYAWAGEVGENYDLSIGEKLLKDTMGQLVTHTPASDTAIILNLGDFFHSDDNTNRTRRSGNILDVDGRHAKILRVGINLLIHVAELAAQKHRHVIVRCLPGNHDPYASLALALGLSAFFHNNERVTVDLDASTFWWFRWGRVFLGATHGDTVPHQDMPGVMASYRPQDWGETEFRYIYIGHVHHKGKGGGEKAGAIWETFQTLAPKDMFGHTGGYFSGRSMTAITHHKEKGEVMRNTVSISGDRTGR